MNARSITQESISLQNIVRGEARNEWLNKEIDTYLDCQGYQKAVVEDIYPDPVFKGLVLMMVNIGETKERRLGFITKEGFAIQFGEPGMFGGFNEVPDMTYPTVLEVYESWLNKFEVKPTAFERGIELRVSKKLVENLKAPAMKLAVKVMSIPAFMEGKVPGAKKLEEFKAVEKGIYRQSQDEKDYVFSFDGQAVEMIADFVLELADVMLPKVVALMAIMDPRGLIAVCESFSKIIKSYAKNLK